MFGSAPEIIAWAACACAGTLALLVIWQRPRSVVPWLFAAGMIAAALQSFCYGLTLTAIAPEEMVSYQNWRLLVGIFLPGIWLYFSLTYARGNRQEFVRAWRWMLVAAFLIPVTLALGFHNKLIVAGGQASADSAWMFQLGFGGTILNLTWLITLVLILMNLEHTYRAAIGTLRWRIKFMVLGLGMIFAVKAYGCVQVLLYHHTLSLTLQGLDALAMLLGSVLLLRALVRPGHFDADIYPTRSDMFRSLTLSLTGIYLLIVGVFAKVVEFLGGDTAFTLKALVLLLALVLGTVLLVSDRARLLTRRFASRHFQRPLYDYRSLWRRFTEETASCIQQGDLCQVTVKLSADVFQALSVSIWLVDERRENLIFGASTFLQESKAARLTPTGPEATELIHALEASADPVDLDAATQPWAQMLKTCHPTEFRKGGHRVCVPLNAAGRLLGVLIVGDRVAGIPFSWQDYDLLKCVADSMAASLLNLQLSQKLMQAGQLEAFQAMSTFFVHDLKNTASTLNLMLKNLPVHFDDPAFREDALRGIGKTVNHINRLIERLGQLRSGLRINPESMDLNEIVRQSLEGLEPVADFNLVKNLQPVPPVALDREQMLKVVTNLVFNAREAVTSNGEVKIETTQSNGWVILSVADNGSGMNPEFINRSLFRPFQTTKKNGLGIGLFQSKMIVEAHQGRIEVHSQPAKGTCFRILLPLGKAKS